MRSSFDRRAAARALWTLGFALMLVHVVLAFQWIYAWDHEAAIVNTVVRSEEIFGSGWRGAIYINYAFILLWLADVVWWWASPASHAARPRWVETTRLAMFLFMFVNGAVIFATGLGRVVGVIAVGAVLVATIRPQGVAAR